MTPARDPKQRIYNIYPKVTRPSILKVTRRRVTFGRSRDVAPKLAMGGTFFRYIDLYLSPTITYKELYNHL